MPRLSNEGMRELRDSRTLVLVIGPDSTESPNIFFELGVALADRKQIVPIATEDVDLSRVSPLLKQLHIVKEKSPKAAGRRIAGQLEKAAAH
jgi:uncharacterized protein (DUF4213/DUF364 family)